MIQAVGKLSVQHQALVEKVFSRNSLEVEFFPIERLKSGRIISFDKQDSRVLTSKGVKFYNWDLLLSVLGPNDQSGEIENKLQSRIDILKAIISLKSIPIGNELHGSIRVHDLAKSSKFYAWLFGVEPKEWTHRYVTFVMPDTKFNFVLLVSDGKELNHDTLYHLGMGVATKQDVINFYHSAVENGFHIEEPPRTTWRGTPLHELWLKDPDGSPIEIYARLGIDELAQMPQDKEPIFLVP